MAHTEGCWARTCINGQNSKVFWHIQSPHGEFSPPDTRLERVHIDNIGPLPPFEGYEHCLTCADQFAK